MKGLTNDQSTGHSAVVFISGVLNPYPFQHGAGGIRTSQHGST